MIDAAWMPAIERVRSLIAPITGERLPFVWTHGDYTLANCLYHRNGDLAAVVDWELSSREGLPLLDILQCMPVPNESNSDARWQRFDAVRMLFNDPTLQRSPRLRAYVDGIGIPLTAVPTLLAMYWVDHVANRIDARAGDPHWMTKRVYQPLEAFKSISHGQPVRRHG